MHYKVAEPRRERRSTGKEHPDGGYARKRTSPESTRNRGEKGRKRQSLRDLLQGWNSILLREETERVSREYDRRNRIVDNGRRMFEITMVGDLVTMRWNKISP